MKAPSQLHLVTLATFASLLSGCEAVKGIFKAGVWVGVIAVVAVVLVATMAVNAFRH